MKVLPLFGAVILLCASISVSAKTPDNCYVSGDTSKSQAQHTYGSKQNPYSSLAEVQADLDCVVINVRYSDTPLDGGIALRDGQSLVGKRGKKGTFPVITNSSGASNIGIGVGLARNNTLKRLHIADTWINGAAGAFTVGGDILFEDVLITGANQSRGFDQFGQMNASIGIASAEDTRLTIKNGEIGEADAISIAYGQFNGFADILISNTTVRDQGHISDGGSEVSSGIAITAIGTSSIEVAVLNTSVSNIGDDVLSNSDGLLLQNIGSGVMNARVDGYHYSNPDGGGAQYSSTGIEMGCLGVDAVGCTFNGTVTNSVIDDAFLAGIQIVDAEIGNGSGGNNTVTADIRDNQISGSLVGIYSLTYMPYATRFLSLVNNTIKDSGIVGMEILTYGADVAEVLIEGNTISNSAEVGLAFYGDTTNGIQLDVGLGGLGSAGENRIINSGIDDIRSYGVPVSAANNWWGSDAGPTSVVELNGGTVDVDPFLKQDPKPGKRKGQH